MKVNLTPAQQQRADELARMTPAQWDAICKHCGVCCMAKQRIAHDMRPLYLNCCCDKFDPVTRQCKIYKTRLKNPYCNKVDLGAVLSDDLLPASCGYVEYIFGPALFPANPDFTRVQPVPDDVLNNMPVDQVEQRMIAESVFWNIRCR